MFPLYKLTLNQVLRWALKITQRQHHRGTESVLIQPLHIPHMRTGSVTTPIGIRAFLCHTFGNPGLCLFHCLIRFLA